MKKVALFAALVGLSLTLGACSSSNSNKDSADSSKKTSVVKKEKTANEKLADQIAKEFNTDGQKLVEASVDKDVIDDQSKTDKDGNAKPHEVIKIMVTDKDTIKKLKAAKEAVDSNTASDDQKMYIAGIQDIITKNAKKLSNSNDVVSFGYAMDADNTALIASSMKDKDIIAPVEI